METLRPQAGMAIDLAPPRTQNTSDAIDEAFSEPALATMTLSPLARVRPLLLGVNLSILLLVGLLVADHTSGWILSSIVLALVAVAMPRLDRWHGAALVSDAGVLGRLATGWAGARPVAPRRPTDSLRQLGRLPLSQVVVDGGHLETSTTGLLGRYYHTLKRGLDICFVLALGIVAIPVLLVICLAIAIDSPGSIFYSQIRVGLNGQRFRIYKLRSMRQDADRMGAVYTEGNDPRVTRVGRFIRLTRIDELPQLWNVLRGEMSVVGPRPEQLESATRFEQEIPYWSNRYATKPGLTGWAQVRYRHTSTIEGNTCKLEHDLYYLKYASMALDLAILLATVRVVFGLQGR